MFWYDPAKRSILVSSPVILGLISSNPLIIDLFVGSEANYFWEVCQSMIRETKIWTHQHISQKQSAPGSTRRLMIGQPISWAPWSPDFIILDFFLRNHIRTNIYKTTIESLKDSKSRIKKDIEVIKKRNVAGCFF